MPDAEVSVTVVDAVLAPRAPLSVRGAAGRWSSSRSCRRTELPLARILLGDLRVLGEAEHPGLLDVALDAVA